MANNAVELKKVGVNLVIDRLGWNLDVFPFTSWPSGRAPMGRI